MKQTDTLPGDARTLGEIAEAHAIPWKVAYNRVRLHGWPVERAVTEPRHTKSTAGRLGRHASHWHHTSPYPQRGA